MFKKLFNIFVFSIFIFSTTINTALAVDCLTSSGDMESYETAFDCETLGGTVITESNRTSENTSAPKKSLLNNIDDASSIANYVEAIYTYGIGVVGILATIVIMIGGLIWITSMGNAARVSNAKDWIGAALTGLALAMFSYTILFIINEDLVKFKPLVVEKVGPANSSEKVNTAKCGDATYNADTQECIERDGVSEIKAKEDLGDDLIWQSATAGSGDTPNDETEDTIGQSSYRPLGADCDSTNICDADTGLVCDNGTCDYGPEEGSPMSEGDAADPADTTLYTFQDSEGVYTTPGGGDENTCNPACDSNRDEYCERGACVVLEND